MPRFQNKPSLADVARRRGQSIFDVLKDWGVDVSLPDEEFDAALQKKCLKEGVKYAPVEREQKPVEKALVEPSKQESVSTVGKKSRKTKITLDESPASEEHLGLDPRAASGFKDPA